MRLLIFTSLNKNSTKKIGVLPRIKISLFAVKISN